MMISWGFKALLLYKVEHESAKVTSVALGWGEAFELLFILMRLPYVSVDLAFEY